MPAWASPSLVLPAALLLSGVVLFWLSRFYGEARQWVSHWLEPLRKKRILTDNEREFFGRLRRALGQTYDVIPQVAMGALIDVDLPQTHPLYWQIRGQFSQKIVDFVVLDKRTGTVITLIELDDRTHDARKDAARDAMTAAAGLRTLRFESRAKPSEAQIRKAVAALVG